MNRTKVAATAKRINTDVQHVKRDLAQDIAKAIDARGLTQLEAAITMRDAPSQVSLVVTGKLRGFSLERLIRMRAMLGAKVRVVVVTGEGPAPRVAYASSTSNGNGHAAKSQV